MPASLGRAADSETACAKINLALHVRQRLPDGYHRIETIFAFLDQGDELSVHPGDDLKLTIGGRFAAGLDDKDNLVLQAADRLAAVSGGQRGAHLHLEKRLPVASGIGGGQDLAPVPDDGLRHHTALLVNPLVPVSTAQIFASWDGIDRGGLADGQVLTVALAGRNDLQKPAVALVPILTGVLNALEHCDPVMARMSGSGATCFALFDSAEAADKAEQYCRWALGDIWTMTGRFR